VALQFVLLAAEASALGSAAAQRLVSALRSCTGCPSRPPPGWRSYALSAPGRRPAGLRFAARRQARAPPPQAAAAPREKARRVRSARQCPEPRMRVVLEPARILERQLDRRVRTPQRA